MNRGDFIRLLERLTALELEVKYLKEQMALPPFDVPQPRPTLTLKKETNGKRD